MPFLLGQKTLPLSPLSLEKRGGIFFENIPENTIYVLNIY
jgi:hypothetical protein